MKPVDLAILIAGVLLSLLIYISDSGLIFEPPQAPLIRLPEVQFPDISVPTFTIPVVSLSSLQSFFTGQHQATEIGSDIVPSVPTPTPLYPPGVIRIPKLSIETEVEHVGTTDTGSMDVPQDAAAVGWYQYGPTPGNRGNAVLSGHYDTPSGRPAIFFQLHKLSHGDTIEVIAQTGERFEFVVTGKDTMPVDIFPGNYVFQDKFGINLNLITCAGVWDAEAKNYQKRLVVYATLKGTQFNSL